MKKIYNICLVSILILSACVLSACSFKKDFSVYIFSSTGGYITVDDSTDKIDMKDILFLKKKTTVKFTAHENYGYKFDYWEINSTPDSEDKVLELEISKETVVKAVFKKDDVVKYTLTFVDENNNTINSTTLKKNDAFTLPSVQARDGFSYVFVDTENENNILNPASSTFTYNYSSNKTFKLQYIANSYTITANNGENYSFELENGYSWTVAHGGSVQFKLNITGDYTAEVQVASPDNKSTITPVNDIYTIENITSNLEITVTLTSNSTDTKTYTATFVNASNSNEYINYINIEYGQMINLSSVELSLSKNGSDVKFYYDSTATNEINSNTLSFNYNSNTTFYYKHFYTVNYPSSSNYTLNLENGYNWTVEEGGEIKFTINIEENSSLNSVSYNSNPLTSTNNVYTISNICENGQLTIDLYTRATVKFTDLTNNLVGIKILSLDDSLTDAKLDTNYYLALNSAFPFVLEPTINMINLVSDYMTYACYVNGTEIEYDEDNNLYNFSVKEIKNYEIVVKIVSTINFSFDYGTIDGEGIMPEDSYFGTANIDINVSKESNEYYYEIDENNVAFNVNGTSKTISELVTELNETYSSTNYKITEILFSDLNFYTWCTIDYSTGTPVFTFDNSILPLSNISRQSDNKTDFYIALIWE